MRPQTDEQTSGTLEQRERKTESSKHEWKTLHYAVYRFKYAALMKYKNIKHPLVTFQWLWQNTAAQLLTTPKLCVQYTVSAWRREKEIMSIVNDEQVETGQKPNIFYRKQLLCRHVWLKISLHMHVTVVTRWLISILVTCTDRLWFIRSLVCWNQPDWNESNTCTLFVQQSYSFCCNTCCNSNPDINKLM